MTRGGGTALCLILWTAFTEQMQSLKVDDDTIKNRSLLIRTDTGFIVSSKQTAEYCTEKT